jgi:hypothetical protein
MLDRNFLFEILEFFLVRFPRLFSDIFGEEGEKMLILRSNERMSLKNTKKVLFLFEYVILKFFLMFLD